MSLSSRCRDSFSAQDISRGDQYFHGERALLADAGDGGVSFLVSGSRSVPYMVELDFDAVSDGLIEAYCDCPRYADGCFCKHLWAVLRELDTRVDLPGNEPLELVFADDLDYEPRVKLPAKSKQVVVKKKPVRNLKGWRKPFQAVKNALNSNSDGRSTPLDQITAGKKQLWYVLRHEDRMYTDGIVIHTFESTRKQDGEWGVPQRKAITQRDIDRHASDEFLAWFEPIDRPGQQMRYGSYYQQDTFRVSETRIRDVMPALASTGRFGWAMSAEQHLREFEPIRWDEREWRLRIRLTWNAETKQIQIVPELLHGQEQRPISEAMAAYAEGLVLFPAEITSLPPNESRWLDALQRDEMLPVPKSELPELLAMLTALPGLPELEIDEQLGVNRETIRPTGKIAIYNHERRTDCLAVDPIFKYGETDIPIHDERQEIWQEEQQTLVRRDHETEVELLTSLKSFPFEKVEDYYTDEVKLSIPLKQFVPLTESLVASDWEVVAHGKPVRQSGGFDIRIRADNDWFDLQADVDFDGISASLPSLLAALKQRSNFVTLDDGSKGILPEEWLQRYARLADVAQEDDGKYRFAKSQALLLDALLAEQAGVRADVNFTKLVKKLKAFDGITPGKSPRSFQGQLRDYQRDGVGWFGFLREFGFGGCLADDMGLGKTVQVLALLESRRTRRLKKGERRLPSIVVVPKSLVFNWIDEASKFTPKLRTFNYTGLDRAQCLEEMDECDLLVTTYGTLRRDIEKLKDLKFDYVILDESQAVKNVKSLSSKAVRLVQANYRLAMTGTPVENHLGELWSLFDFLNPGMLGSGAAFKRISRTNGDDTESLAWLSNAIRPFILRRTKQQVLTELPEKTEQTLVCDMTVKQKKKYNELRDYYRAHLSKKVDDVGIKRSKIHVLEALLRLRQAACDPRLLGEKEPAGAKIELLMEQLDALLEDGHKALIFSQFTSLLALVRQELDARGWSYEYLDGKTRKRAEKVERFQNDDECPLFLISLKAGGSGLNLTAADYVFILDPWWNPAVEAQAVDRAHRIGQTKSVMAYRILCKDTVEDKIIQMQKSKRDLADAIITADKSLISELSLDDLQMLLE